jgi:hypothetical protein
VTAQIIWTRQADFSAGYASAPDARAFVESALRTHELTYLVGDVQVAVSELISVVLGGAHSPVSVMLEELLFCLRLTVHNGSSPPAVAQTLTLLEQSSEQWGVDTAANGDESVWVLFALQSPPFRSRQL